MNSRKKYLLLIFGSVLFAIIIYIFGIQKTIDQYKEFKKLSQQSENSKNAPQEMLTMKKELTSFEKLEGQQGLDSSDDQTNLLSQISAFCREKDLVIKDFPETVQKQENSYLIGQNKVVVSGNFADALQLIYFIEQKAKLGQVASLEFKMVTERMTKRSFLQTSFYLQKITGHEGA